MIWGTSGMCAFDLCMDYGWPYFLFDNQPWLQYTLTIVHCIKNWSGSYIKDFRHQQQKTLKDKEHIYVTTNNW